MVVSGVLSGEKTVALPPWSLLLGVASMEKRGNDIENLSRSGVMVLRMRNRKWSPFTIPALFPNARCNPRKARLTVESVLGPTMFFSLVDRKRFSIRTGSRPEQKKAAEIEPADDPQTEEIRFLCGQRGFKNACVDASACIAPAPQLTAAVKPASLMRLRSRPAASGGTAVSGISDHPLV